MSELNNLTRQIEITRRRLFPRIEERFSDVTGAAPASWEAFDRRLNAEFPRLFRLLYSLYHQEYDFYFHLEDLLDRLAQAWIGRAASLKELDAVRSESSAWYLSNQMLGGVCYVDLYAGSLEGVKERIPYFKELGLTYLHLMPLYRTPEAENDGGYAVSSYRETHLGIGSIQDLVDLASTLRGEGISLALDFVFNHTSDEHEWARGALAGDPEFEEFYKMFPDRTIPDLYDRTLREIFPGEHPGSFSYRPEIDRWVWTTFHSYQWDLNYSNPAVFNAMVSEMLFLANLGVEVLRLDALAFLWKEMGTSCENLPETHLLIQAFNAVASIAAPAMVFKSEAIVHPDDVVKYIHPEECPLSYNPLVMALLWESLATRKVELLRAALSERFELPDGCAWVNYVRGHDDIGWTFSDEDARRLGISGYDHRLFLNEFYTGRFPGSFARGIPFQSNPKTGDARISGTTASLAGLELGIREEDQEEIGLAIRRILLLHSIILSLPGIPLIYLGDELGTLNDYSYRSEARKAKDSRWVHRPRSDAEALEKRLDPQSIEGQLYQRLAAVIRLRKENKAFGQGTLEMVEIDNPHVLAYQRREARDRLLVFANFSERAQEVRLEPAGLAGLGEDLITGNRPAVSHGRVRLEPYQFACYPGR